MELKRPLAILPGKIEKIVIYPIVSKRVYDYLRRKKEFLKITMSSGVKKEVAKFFSKTNYEKNGGQL